MLQCFFSGIISAGVFAIYLVIIQTSFEYGTVGVWLGVIFALLIPIFGAMVIIKYNHSGNLNDFQKWISGGTILTDISLDFKDKKTWINIVISVLVINIVVLIVSKESS